MKKSIIVLLLLFIILVFGVSCECRQDVPIDDVLTAEEFIGWYIMHHKVVNTRNNLGIDIPDQPLMILQINEIVTLHRITNGTMIQYMLVSPNHYLVLGDTSFNNLKVFQQSNVERLTQ